MSDLKLPLSITGKKELIKVQRELEAIHEKMIEGRVVAEQLSKQVDMPKISETTNEFLYMNQLTLDSKNIQALIEQISEIKDGSPMLKVSFAAEPDKNSIAKIVGWFRKEVDPAVLLTIGIQPSIAGGCVIQTPGHRYDFSLRKHIMSSQDKFKAVIAKDIFQKQPEAEAPKPEQPAAQEAPSEDEAKESA